MSLLTLLENANEVGAPQFGRSLTERLEPWITPDLERYAKAIGVMFDPTLELVEEVGTDGAAGFIPSYGRLFDVDLCPAKDLGYLGQYVGVVIPVGAHEAEARQIVRAESGQNRGTLSSVESAVVRSISSPWMPGRVYAANGPLVSHEAKPGEVIYYTVVSGFTSGRTFSTGNLEAVEVGTQFNVLEREKPSGQEAAYHLTIVVRPEQLTPAGNTVAITLAINAVKPGGIILHIVLSNEPPSWAEATKTWEEVAGGVEWQTLKVGDV